MLEFVFGLGILIVLVVVLIVIPVLELGWWWRRKFRLHLSTLLAMTMIAGCVTALNLRRVKETNPRELKLRFPNTEMVFNCGWPLQVLRPEYWKKYSGPDDPDVDFYVGMALNIWLGLNLVSLGAMALEAWVERKKA